MPMPSVRFASGLPTTSASDTTSPERERIDRDTRGVGQIQHLEKGPPSTRVYSRGNPSTAMVRSCSPVTRTVSAPRPDSTVNTFAPRVLTRTRASETDVTDLVVDVEAPAEAERVNRFARGVKSRPRPGASDPAPAYVEYPAGRRGTSRAMWDRSTARRHRR